MRILPLSEALGNRLGHDVTEVNPEKKIKRRAFRRGHIVTVKDLERLRDLGKRSIYVLDENSDEVHEDDAALTVAPLVAGKNVFFDAKPCEGKISFYADCDGLFQVDVDRLYCINSLEIPSLPTLHTNFPVKKGTQVAAFRIIPLTCDRSIIDKVLISLRTPLLNVRPYILKKAAIVVTGNEIYEGRVKDGFISNLSAKVRRFGVSIVDTVVLPDEKEKISKAVNSLSMVSDIIFVTGGTSVDPDDVTVKALQAAGVNYKVKGNPVQPGNNFTVGYKKGVVVCAVPAAGLFFKSTALDIFLPRLLAGEIISKEDFHRAGHGGLCHFCQSCRFPVCPFGVGS